MKRTLITLTLTLTLAAAGHAQLVTFEFGNNTSGGQAQLDLDGLANGSTTASGLTLTLTASSGSFNSTSTAGFGINATPAGDSTTQFDDASTDGAEFMTLQFSQNIEIVSVSLTSFGSSDEAYLSIDGGPAVTINQADFNFAPGSALSSLQSAEFGFQAGNGFELQSLTVQTVPEPASASLLIAGLAATGLLGNRRRI